MDRTLIICTLGLICLAGSVKAKPKEANPLLGKSVIELAAVLDRSQAEADRLNAAQQLRAKMPLKSDRLKRNQTMPSYPKAEPAVVKVLLQGLDDSSSAVRYECRRALGCGGEIAIPGLISAMASQNPDLRSYAADALGDMGAYLDAANLPLEKVVVALQKALGDKDYRVRVSATIALWRIGERSAPALPKLIKLLKDDEWAVADAAVRAVAAADPSGQKSVPALVKLLGNRKHDLREFVCNELAAMGQSAKAGIPALIKLLDTDPESWYAGKSAGDALAKIISIDPRNPPVDDKLVKERPKVIAALAKSVATQKTPFMADDRLASLLKCKCEIGPEVLPALPLAKQRLQEWIYAPMRSWVPRRELELFLASAGQHDKANTVAFVKELIADKKVDQTQGLKELNQLLTKLEVTK